MEYFAGNIDYWLALATVAAQVVTVALLLALVFKKRLPAFGDTIQVIAQRGLVIGFLVTVFGTAMTLVYSDLFGFTPCDLCWWQRIFLYPQVVLFGMAAWKRDVYIIDYALVLSIFGFGVALYHHLLQMFPDALPCPATGVSCAQRIIFELNYVTFPMMAVALFGFLIILSLIIRTRTQPVGM